MDVQPSLSPFSPALSYSLLVDDFFSIEDHCNMMTFTDDEIYEEDENNFAEASPEHQQLRQEEKSMRDCNDNVLIKNVNFTNDLELGADVMESQGPEEIINFNPRISDENLHRFAEDAFQETKENFNISMDYQTVTSSTQSDETYKTLLLSSLCGSPASNNSPSITSPATSCQCHSHPETPPSSVGSSPGPPSPMLPPCRVCGEKASGFHYGANTCEACKGFFRRSLQRKQSYRCLGSNNCDISSGKRNVCAACRYQKCLSLGMSKNAIKTGRYTHAKKTKDIQEVKRLQRQQMRALQEDLSGSPNMLLSDTNSEAVDEETAERIVERIMKIHHQQTPHTPEFFEKLPHKEHEYLLRRKLKQKVFGPLKPISHDEYSNIYHSTGIDVDGRRAMLEHMLPCIERAVKRFVTFAKAVPGFKELILEDQVKLIKGSRFEAWLISSYRAFNPDHLLYTHYCGNTVHMEGMARLYDESFIRDVFKMVAHIKKLDLTEEEECVVKAILVLFRDRCILQNPEQVEASQLKLVQALDYIHRKRRPKDRIFFGRITSVLTEMRTLTDLHTTQENKIQMEWATDIRMPPLLYELFYV